MGNPSKSVEDLAILRSQIGAEPDSLEKRFEEVQAELDAQKSLPRSKRFPGKVAQLIKEKKELEKKLDEE